MGYQTAAKALEQDSGMVLQTDAVTSLCEEVLEGNWERALESIKKVQWRDHGCIMARAHLLEQKYHELIEASCHDEALLCLQQELSTSGLTAERLDGLAALLLCDGPGPLRNMLGTSAPPTELRAERLLKIQRLLAASQVVPSGRLEQLIGQALQYQATTCRLHNTRHSKLTLLEDHCCEESVLPHFTEQILQGHSDEVWCAKFSSNGKLLATASTDLSIIVWDMEQAGMPQ
ncbi:unnamed protein product, partial [Chrysoparadoxa australica]